MSVMNAMKERTLMRKHARMHKHIQKPEVTNEFNKKPTAVSLGRDRRAFLAGYSAVKPSVAVKENVQS